MPSKISLISFFFFLSNFSLLQVLAVVEDCGEQNTDGCNNKKKALPLKIIAIISILATSMIGVSLPLVTRSVPALSPQRSLFIIVKSFAAGIILATGFMHVLPDSFEMLSSACLKKNPWHEFPFTGFVSMLSAIVTLMVDSMTTSFYAKKQITVGGVLPPDTEASSANDRAGHSHLHGSKLEIDGAQLLRYRVIAMKQQEIAISNLELLKLKMSFNAQATKRNSVKRSLDIRYSTVPLCWCKLRCELKIVESVKKASKGKLYCCCPIQECNFFCWIKPVKVTWVPSGMPVICPTMAECEEISGGCEGFSGELNDCEDDEVMSGVSKVGSATKTRGNWNYVNVFWVICVVLCTVFFVLFIKL